MSLNDAAIPSVVPTQDETDSVPSKLRRSARRQHWRVMLTLRQRSGLTGVRFADRAGGMLAMTARCRMLAEFNAILRIERRYVPAAEQTSDPSSKRGDGPRRRDRALPRRDCWMVRRKLERHRGLDRDAVSKSSPHFESMSACQLRRSLILRFLTASECPETPMQSRRKAFLVQTEADNVHQLDSDILTMPSRLGQSLRIIWRRTTEIAASGSIMGAVFFFARALRDPRSAGAWLTFLSAFERTRALAPAPLQTFAKPFGNYAVHGLSTSERVAMLRSHYNLTAMTLPATALAAIWSDCSVELGTLRGKRGQSYRLTLDPARYCYKEGELSFSLTDEADGLELARAMGCWRLASSSPPRRRPAAAPRRRSWQFSSFRRSILGL